MPFCNTTFHYDKENPKSVWIAYVKMTQQMIELLVQENQILQNLYSQHQHQGMGAGMSTEQSIKAVSPLQHLIQAKDALYIAHEEIFYHLKHHLCEQNYSKDEVYQIKKLHEDFSNLSKDNIFYLDMAQEFSQWVLNLFVSAHNELTKGAYTKEGIEQSYAKHTSPMVFEHLT